MNIPGAALSPFARAIILAPQDATKIMSNGISIRRGSELKANSLVDWTDVESSVKSIFHAKIRKPRQGVVQSLGISVGGGENPCMRAWLSGNPLQVDRLEISPQAQSGAIRRYSKIDSKNIMEYLASLRKSEVEHVVEKLGDFNSLKATVLAHLRDYGEIPQQLFEYLLGISSKM